MKYNLSSCFNLIDEAGIKQVDYKIKDNTSLTTLDLNSNRMGIKQGDKVLALIELQPDNQASAGILKDTGYTLYYAARTGAQGLVTMVFFDTATNAIMQYAVVIALSGGPVGVASQVISFLAPYILSSPHAVLASTVLASYGLYPENVINTGKYLANTLNDIFAGNQPLNSDCKELAVISTVKKDVESDEDKDVDAIIEEFDMLDVVKVEFIQVPAQSWTEWFTGFIWGQTYQSQQLEMECIGDNRIEEIKGEDCTQS